MAEELNKVMANALPLASSVTDNDMLLMVQGGRNVRRVPPSLMKGKKGDPGVSVYLGVTDTHIQWKQGPSGNWQNLFELERMRGPRGERIVFKKEGGTIYLKYEGEPDSAYSPVFDREELKMRFTDLVAADVDQLKLHFSDLTDADKAELMKPATDAAALALATTETATNRLNSLSDHRDEIRDGFWWRWNETTGEWYNTGEIAKGNVMFATFEIDPATGQLTMFTDPEYTGANFELDQNGKLQVII